MTEPQNIEFKRAVTQPLLIDSRQVGELLNLSTRTVWRLLSAGKLPQPVRIGRSVRWSRSDLETWIANGCPETAPVEVIQSEQGKYEKQD
jgi:excisionase family DNA binding protein